MPSSMLPLRMLVPALVFLISPVGTGGQANQLPNCENIYNANLPMRFDIVAGPGMMHLSDGRGEYLDDRATCTASRDEAEGFFAFGAPNRREWEECTGKETRAWTIDLGQPVEGSGGVSRGKITSGSMHFRLVVRRDSLGRFVGLRDMAVGESVDALYLRIVKETGGNIQLIFAPAATQCAGYTQAEGSTAARVQRVSSTVWEVDLPPGSTGRLKSPGGRRGGASSLIDHGLFRFTARYRIRSTK